MRDSEPLNPTHTVECDRAIAWTTGNIGEALPGVTTPLTWTFFAAGVEPALRRGFYRLGALRRVELEPDGIASTFFAPFFGRTALNLNFMGEMADRMPSSSAAEVETQLLGTVRSDTSARPRYTRYPVVALRAPTAAMAVSGRGRTDRANAEQWHQQVLRRIASGIGEQSCRDILARSVELTTQVMTNHLLATMLATPVFDAVSGLAHRAGQTEAQGGLLSGLNTVEVSVGDDLWALAHEELSEEEFLRRHGHLGPGGVHVSGVSWREDPQPLRTIAAGYTGIPQRSRPRLVCAARARTRHETSRKVIGALPARSRPGARVLLRLATHFVPLREVGRDSWVRVTDAARAATRELGRLLYERGALAAPDDVSFCTVRELLAAGPPQTAEIELRRTQWQAYQQLVLPPHWEGVPDPLAPRSAVETDLEPAVLHGVAVGHGTVEGVARVVHHPGTDDFEPGEVLVCSHTDPSWVSLFLLAAAVVVDNGGAASHGAIVARELGIPAVTNTRNGTTRIRSGDRVRVDANGGTVTVLEKSLLSPQQGGRKPA